DAAAPGAIVALAAGVYDEDVNIAGKCVRLWGRCPALVLISGTAIGKEAVGIEGADKTELRALAITGSAGGISVRDSADVLLQAIWIHDTASSGVDVEQIALPTSIAIKGSLIEGTHDVAGVRIAGATATMEASTVRATRSPDALVGFGLAAEPNGAGDAFG